MDQKIKMDECIESLWLMKEKEQLILYLKYFTI